MDIAELLQTKFPEASFERDILLRDQGNGIEIYEWNMPGIKQPTSKDLEEWAQDENLISAFEQKQKEIMNGPVIKQLEVIDLKSIRALRNNDETILNDLEAQAILLRAQLL